MKVWTTCRMIWKGLWQTQQEIGWDISKGIEKKNGSELYDNRKSYKMENCEKYQELQKLI